MVASTFVTSLGAVLKWAGGPTLSSLLALLLCGSFAPILALLAFLYLAARLTIYGIEANVVKAEHLWPRSLTDKNLTAADRAQLEGLAKREERVEEQTVEVDF
jgi:membrane protein